MNNTEKTIAAVSAVAVIVAVIVVAASMASVDNTNEQWEDRAQDAIEAKGYTGVVMTACTYLANGDTMSVLGSFTSHGQLYSYIITFVKENGSWKLYETLVY